VKVRIYVEGGGDHNEALQTRCRKGFADFFRKAGFTGRMPPVVACGSRNNAYDSFCTAVANAGPNQFPLLLVDSEAPVSEQPWKHLKNRDKWDRPANAADDQAHLMVQCMESWFLADREHLARFFGQGFNENSLPGNENIEEIPKKTVFSSLKMATRETKTKGEYGKGQHSFAILGGLDPAKVRAASKHAADLLETLNKKCGS